MAYDPTKPVENTLEDAAEMRAQFAGLKELIDAQQVVIAALQAQINLMLAQGSALAQQVATLTQQVNSLPTPAIVASEIANNSAANVNAVQPLAMPGYPPSQADVLGMVGKLNELVTGLHR